MYAAETFAVAERLEELLASCDHRMLRYMCFGCQVFLVKH